MEVIERQLNAISLFATGESCKPNSPLTNLEQYEEVIVFFSGGKDGMACILLLLDLGVPVNKIEVHHHIVDGCEGSNLFDWPVTRSYCKKFSEAFGFRYVETWKKYGFEGEMLRDNRPTAPTIIPSPDGGLMEIGGKGKNGTRLKFPQVSSSLSCRYCSSYTKIDVAARYLANTPRFNDGKPRLIVTGERAEESPQRATYEAFQIHKEDRRTGPTKRYLDHARLVHSWTEAQVWQIIARYGVFPHPAYWVGASRASCQFCIFGNDDACATNRFLAPDRFQTIRFYEKRFGLTIHRSKSIEERADKGTVFPTAAKYAALAMNEEYTGPIFVDNWELPPGAFKANGGNF